MQHRGEILAKIFKDNGLKVTPIARKMGIDRGTIYRHFDDDNLSVDYILRYGKATKVDMKKYYPDLINIAIDEEVEFLEKPSYEELEISLSQCKDKYIDLLERYNNLLLETK